MPRSSLMSWWPADHDASDIWDGNDGTAYGVMYEPGVVGEAFRFNGTDAFVDLGNGENMRLLNDFTMEAWVRLEPTQGSYYVVLSHGHTSTTGWVWQAYGGQLKALFGNGTGMDGPAWSTDLTDNRWHHLVAVKSRAEGSSVYLDGRLDGRAAWQTADVVLTGLDLRLAIDPVAGRNMRGAMDEIRFYDQPLSAAEILANYQAGPAGVCHERACLGEPEGMVSWWPAQDDAADIRDGNDGVAHNVVYQSGKVGSAFGLDGVSSYVDLGNGANTQARNNFSVAAWVRLDPIQASYYVVLSHGHSPSTGWVWQALGSQLKALFGDGVGMDGPAWSIDLRDNRWHHLVAVKSSTQGGLTYLDGRLNGQSPGRTRDVVLTGQNLQLGRDPTALRYLRGAVDEVQLFNRVLTASEVLLIYRAGTAGLCEIPPVCGNGILESIEACDDGNTDKCDGCSPSCELEPDRDADGVFDACDNCAQAPNSDQQDYDGDCSAFCEGDCSCGDACDPCPGDAMEACDPDSVGQCLIGPQGGVCATANGEASILVPPLAMTSTTTFSFFLVPTRPLLQTSEGSNIVPAFAYYLSPARMGLQRSATVRFSWAEDALQGYSLLQGQYMQVYQLPEPLVAITPECRSVPDDLSPEPPCCNDVERWYEFAVSELSFFALGASVDSDGDGIDDDSDACPDEDASNLDADQNGCIDRICDLVALVDSAQISNRGIRNALRNAHAQWACVMLNQERTRQAMNKLTAFAELVEEQRGTHVSETSADLLTEFAANAYTFLLATAF